jgi:MFS family permease
MVILEYPTGVIGDVFGHKLSVQIGYLLGGISFLILGSSTNIPYEWTYIILLIFAAGSAFISGSDVALLHSISKDFKKDMSWSNQFAGWFQSAGLVIGGLLAVINLQIPFILTGIAFLISFFIIWNVKPKKVEKSEDLGMWQTALLGMKESFLNMKIFFPIFLSSVILMYLISEKWVLPEVFTRSQIPIALFGVTTALVFLFRSQASAIYRKIGEQPYWIPILGMILSSILISFNYLNILGLFLIYGFAAFITTQTDVTINEKVDGRARASVVSFRNLLVRFINSPYLLIISFASANLAFEGVNLVMTATLSIFIILVVVVNKVRMVKNKAI